MTAVRPRKLEHEPHQCVIVQCRVVFLKIGEIETIKERYNGEAFIQVRRRDWVHPGEESWEYGMFMVSNSAKPFRCPAIL